MLPLVYLHRVARTAWREDLQGRSTEPGIMSAAAISSPNETDKSRPHFSLLDPLKDYPYPISI